MVLLLKKVNILNLNFYNIKMKYEYKKNILYLKGTFGCINVNLLKNFNINFFNLKKNLKNLYIELNSGWVSVLYLNGLGFKATKKYLYTNKKYWRFNVGHSHVFLYFTPRNVILKTRKRHLCFFAYKKGQILDITEKIKKFHIPDVYKGIGIKYPNEIIKLKKGKTRQ